VQKLKHAFIKSTQAYFRKSALAQKNKEGKVGIE
jgi:hypothetical protein